MKKLSLVLALLLAAQPAMAATTTVQLNVQTPATGPTQPFDFDNDGTNNWSLTRCWDGVTKCSLNSTDGGLNVHITNAGDANLTVNGSITTANNASTGLAVVNFINTADFMGYPAGTAILNGTATAASAFSTTGFSGYNSIYVECTGLGTAGLNWFEVDIGGAGGGVNQARQATFTGPTFAGVFNAAGATFLNVMADTFTAGSTPACVMRGSQNFATPSQTASPVVGPLSHDFSLSGAATTKLVTGISGLSIVLTGFSAWTDGNATGPSAVQLESGTGAGCTTPTLIGAAMSFPAGQGLNQGGSVGQTITLPPGQTLCAVTSTSNAVNGNLTIGIR